MQTTTKKLSGFIYLFFVLCINAWAETAETHKVEVDEDSTYSFAISDFGTFFFSDRIIILSLPDKGSLLYNNSEIDVSGSGFTILTSNINRLTFTPEPDDFGVDYTGFKFNKANALINTETGLSMTISVNPVNDPPFFNAFALNPISIQDIASTQTVEITGIYPGADNEWDQILTFSAEESEENKVKNISFSYIQGETVANLSFDPVPGANGSMVLEVILNDGEAENNVFSRKLEINIDRINIPPTFADIADYVIDESVDPQSITITGISPGADYETYQTVTFNAVSDNPALTGEIDIAYNDPSPTATLTFAPNDVGPSEANVTVTANDRIDTVEKSFKVTFDPANKPPTMNAVPDKVILEDEPQQNVVITGISPGPAYESGQQVSMDVTSGDTDIIVIDEIEHEPGEETGLIKFTPVPNAFGEVTITVTLDDGQAVNNIAVYTFKVTVTPVNDPPTLNPISNVEFPEGTEEKIVALSGISPGPPNESDQTLSLTASSSNVGLIPTPEIEYTPGSSAANLIMNPAPFMAGNATITVTVNDGQAENNIITRSFNVTVTEVNDPPTIDPIEDLVINEDATQQTIALTGITAGPNENQTLAVTAVSDKPDIIPSPLNVSYSSPNNAAQLTFTPLPNTFGEVNITVTVNDGQPENNITTRTFKVTINPVADTPAITNASANEGQLSTSGLVISRNPADGNEVTHFKITDITGGTLYLNNGTTVINNNSFITYAQGQAGLRFRSSGSENGSIKVQASLSNNNNGLGGNVITGTININARPTVKSGATLTINMQEDQDPLTVSLDSRFVDQEDDITQLVFEVRSVSNSALFNSVAVTGANLNIELAKDKNGSSTLVMRCTDTGGAFVEATFTINVQAVNDPPVFTLSRSSVIQEINFTGVEMVNVIPGPIPEDEQGQVVTYKLEPESVDFANVTINSSNGRIQIRSVPGGSGSQNFKVIANDGQAVNNIHEELLFVSIDSENTPPIFQISGNVTVNEDFATPRYVEVTPDPVPEWEQDQVVTYSLSPSSVAFANVSINSATGRVTISSVPNRHGEQEFTITANDGQAVNNTFRRTFMLRVLPVNDPPTLDNIPGPIVIEQNAPEQTITLTGITPGPFESEQTVDVTATSSNTAIIPNPVVLYENPNTTAPLTFKPVQDAFGTVVITVKVIDNGLLFVEKSFTVEVRNLNSPPFFQPITSPINVLENSPEHIISLQGINAGPNETQALEFTTVASRPELFEYININYNSPATTGQIRFKTAQNMSGSADL
ncbi:MAG: tandem-95 repeat protein, partial [Cyclobacteriaceae bacterium]